MPRKLVFIDGRSSAWPPEFTKGHPELRELFYTMVLDIESKPRTRGRVKLTAVFGDEHGEVKKRSVHAWWDQLILDQPVDVK